MMINLKKLGTSFKVAFSGLGYALKKENTFKAGVIVALVIIFFAFYYPLTPAERAIIFLTIFAVLAMELMNMQVERTTNLIDLKDNSKIKTIKDLAAGAVLILVIMAAVVGALIFIPYIFNLK